MSRRRDVPTAYFGSRHFVPRERRTGLSGPRGTIVWVDFAFPPPSRLALAGERSLTPWTCRLRAPEKDRSRRLALSRSFQVVLDEFRVPFALLILVVCFLVDEDKIQRDVEIAVIELFVQIAGQAAGPK